MIALRNAPVILVTGATGWLGRCLLAALADAGSISDTKQRVRCLVVSDEEASAITRLGPMFEAVKGDIRDVAACRQLCSSAEGGLLFHIAGVIHPRRVSEFFEINVSGTQQVLAAAMSANVGRVVYMSSNSPCGCNPHPDHLFDEASPYNPYMNYGRSKMLAEIAVTEAHFTGRIATVIIRAPWFYGPNQPARQTLFFAMIRDGRFPLLAGGHNLRSMAYTDNLVQGLLLAAESPHANGRIYWIADERPYAMHEVVDTVERLLETEFHQNCTHRRMKLPALAGDIAYAADKALQAAGIYNQKIHVLSEMNKTIACSVASARRELGYAPTIALEEGMRRSIQSLVQPDGTLPF